MIGEYDKNTNFRRLVLSQDTQSWSSFPRDQVRRF